MSQTLALAKMRRVAYTRTQRAYAPILTGLLIVLVGHTAAPSSPDGAYAFSAALLFVVFAWQARAVLDTEPDTQRGLSRLAVGSRAREITAGLLAVVTPALPIVVAALIAPLLAGFVGLAQDGLLPSLGFGLWIHVLSAVAATAVGAITSRAIIPQRGWAMLLLLCTYFAVLVLGSRESVVVRWLVPQLVAASNVSVASAILITLHALLWSGLLFGCYAWLRRSRA